MANLAYMTTEETIELWVEKNRVGSRHAGDAETRQQAFYVHVILWLVI
jgi:hypothetical protein